MIGRLDSQTVTVGESIDHGASASANLAQAGSDMKAAFTPDHISKAVGMMRSDGHQNSADFGFSSLIGAIGLPFAIAGDAIELLTKPASATKNALDAAFHGVMAGFKKVF